MWLLLFLFSLINSERVFKYPANSITKQSILKNHQKLIDENRPRLKKNIQLAYVTPWNSHGYELSKNTAHKLSHVSPVWFQAKPDEDGCIIEGTNDINREWMKDVRKKNEEIKIVPRLIFEEWSSQDMKTLLISSKMARKCAKRISDFYKRNKFDGIVIEVYTQVLQIMKRLQIKIYLIEMMEQFAKIFKKSNLEVIFTVPAALDGNNTPKKIITPEEFEKLMDFSDYIQIMSYDHHKDNEMIAIAPLDWVQNNLLYLGKDSRKMKKIMMGFNWYGYELNNKKAEAITFKRFLEVLKLKESSYIFDENTNEHKLITPYSTIYYPSMTSIELRIMLARKYDTGISIWEYGQGLDYFTNLLD